MDKKTITIEEIKTNPNLDLNERIVKYSQDKIWSDEDLEDLAIASIEQEYEYWVNNRTNISERTNTILTQILNGHIISNIEAFEMICDEPQKVEQYANLEKLKQRISSNNGISSDDFEFLCKIIGFDLETTKLIKQGYENNGLIIDSYQTEDSYHK